METTTFNNTDLPISSLKRELNSLKVETVQAKQIKIIQKILKQLITKYAIQIDSNFTLYPLEVEAYYFHKKHFRDNTVHRNNAQKNRFGKFYFHRKGDAMKNNILNCRAGVDLCLSDSEECFFGVLLRSAKIKLNDKIISVFGPSKLANLIYKQILGNTALEKGNEQQQSTLKKVEEQVFDLVIPESDPREDKHKVYNCSRHFTDKQEDKLYDNLLLRSLIELFNPVYKYKNTYKIVAEYMFENEIEPTKQNVKKQNNNRNSIKALKYLQSLTE